MTSTLSSGNWLPGDAGSHDCGATQAMQSLVDAIFQRLTDAGIPHCLLRNRDLIPDGLLGWTDLDLMVSDTVSDRQVVDLFIDLEPALIAPVREGFTAMFFPVRDQFLRIDLFNGDIEWRAAAYGMNDDILANRWADNGIMVASTWHQAFLAWFSRLLQLKEMAPRYGTQITETMRAEPVAFRQLLARTFGDGLGEELATMALEGRPQDAETIVPKLRRALWIHAFRRHPATTLMRVAKQLWNALEHRLHPSGLSVAIIGLDHEKNKTVCRTISTLPSRMVPFVITEYSPYDRTENTSSPSTKTRIIAYLLSILEGTASRPSSPLRRVPWHGAKIYALGYLWLREVIWIRQRLAHTKLMLRDYHPIADMLTDWPQSEEHPTSPRKCFSHLVPKSDVVIILDAPGDRVPTRYLGVPHENASRPVAERPPLTKHRMNVTIIDASQPLDDVIRDVIRVITNTAFARTQSRFHLTPRATMAHQAPHTSGHSVGFSIQESRPFEAGRQQ